jgi:hypothetical protein
VFTGVACHWSNWPKATLIRATPAKFAATSFNQGCSELNENWENIGNNFEKFFVSFAGNLSIDDLRFYKTFWVQTRVTSVSIVLGEKFNTLSSKRLKIVFDAHFNPNSSDSTSDSSQTNVEFLNWNSKNINQSPMVIKLSEYMILFAIKTYLCGKCGNWISYHLVERSLPKNSSRILNTPQWPTIIKPRTP